MPGFERYGAATICTGTLILPHFESCTLVILVGPTDEKGDSHAIGVASAERFRASRMLRTLAGYISIAETRPIDRLADAIIDEYGNATLSDGTHVFDVVLDRHEMPSDLTERERLALTCCLGWHEKTGEVDPSIPYQEVIERLSDVRIDSLEHLVEHADVVRRKYPRFPSISREVFRTSLWKTGLRRSLDRR